MTSRLSKVGGARRKFRKTVAGLLTVSLALHPMHFYVLADEMADIGRDGQQYAQDMADNFKAAPPSADSTTITLPTLDPNAGGAFTNSATDSVNISDLFPGTSASSNTSMSDYFPAGAEPDLNALQGVSEDDENMTNAGKDIQQKLWQDAQQSEPSTVGGQAYKILIDMANTPKPDLTNEPYLVKSQQVFTDIDQISQEFGDCTTSTLYQDISTTNHIPDYKTCEKILDKSTQCDVNHSIDAGVIKHHSGPFNLKPVDDNSLELWVGDVGDNLFVNGHCTIVEESVEYKVVNPAAIKKVTLTRAVYDDYIQVWVGKPGEETKVWNGPNNNFPPETGGKCELKKSWNHYPNLDITNAFMANVAKDDIVRIKFRVSYYNGGEGYFSLRLDYDPDKVVMGESWSPQSCIDATKGVADGFATGSATCAIMPAEAVETGCVTINHVKVCEDQVSPPPLYMPTTGISPLCTQVAVDVDYNFYQGSYCFTAADGDEVCVQSGGTMDTCQQYENDAQCGFVSQDCLLTAQDGTCYVNEQTWDCGEDIQVPDVTATQNIQCAGPVRCMGADCLDPNQTQSTSFNEVAAKLNAAQLMTQDMSCVENDGNANVECKVFSGEDYECKIAVGGAQDCCDVPTNTSVGDYIQGLMAMARLDASLTKLEGGAIKGAYQTLRTPIEKTVSTVTKPFASYAENIKGAVTEFFDPVTTYVENLKGAIKDKITEIINKVLTSAKNLIAGAGGGTGGTVATDQVADQAGKEMTKNMAGAANTLMAAYTAYVVAMMIIQAIYKCEDEEFELASKKDTKSCTHLGSYCAQKWWGVCIEKREAYCCFNSPMSRIINQQLRPQLGTSFGDPEHPDCDGITLDQLENVDWTQVDLSEWTALLSKHDLMPDVNAMTMESLTGSGSNLNDISEGGTRVNAADRATQRYDTLDSDAIRREAAENTSIDVTGGQAPSP